MRNLTGRIQRLDEFFESMRWKRWTNWFFGISSVLLLLMIGVNIDTIIAVLLGQPS